MSPVIPSIEIPDNTDAFGIRRPNSKLNARNSFDRPFVCAEFFINEMMVSCIEEINVEIGQCRQKRIRICTRFQMSIVIFFFQKIPEYFGILL